MTIARKEKLNSRLFPYSFLIIAGPIAILLSIAADESTLPSTSCDFDGDGCFDGFCYQFLPSVSDFSEARQKCMEIIDYNLLSLHSQEESEFVARLLCTVNATSEVWTSGYTRALDMDNLNKSFSWLVDDIKLIIMNWMSEFDTIDPDLDGLAATIVLSNRSGNLHYQTWAAVPPHRVDRHALCKRRMNNTDDSCLSSTVIFNDESENCTADEVSTTTSISTSFSSTSPLSTSPSTTITSASSTTVQAPHTISTSHSTLSIYPTVPTTPSSSTTTWSAAPSTSFENSTSASTSQSTSSISSSETSTGTPSSDTKQSTYGTTNQSISDTTSQSTSESTSSTTSQSTSESTSQSTSGTTNQSTSASTSHPTSSTTSQSTSESTSQSTSGTTNQSTSASTSQLTSSTTSQSTSESTSQSTSGTTNQSTSSSTSQSTPGTTSQTTSASTSQSTSSTTGKATPRQSTVTTTFTTRPTSPKTSTTLAWCSATSFGGCDWQATEAGKYAVTSCPENSTGSATWYCDPETLVFEPEDTPNFSQCVNDWVEDMQQEISFGYKSALELAESLWLNASTTQVFYSKDLRLLQQIIVEIDRKFVNETDLHAGVNYTTSNRIFCQYLIYTCDVLLDTNQSVAWDQLNEERSLVADQLSLNVENIGFILATALNNQQDNIQRNNVAVFVERRPKDAYADQGFQFTMTDGSSDQWQGITISLPNGFQENSFGNSTSVVTILYSNMQTYLGDSYTDTTLAAKVITNVIGLSIGLENQRVHFEKGGIQFRIPHSIPDDTHYHICSFWNNTRLPSGLWDSSGCTLMSQDSQYTTCTCNHLTDFAILLDINGIIQTMSPLAQEILNLLTIFCGSLSAVCLVICLVTFYSLRILRCIRTSVTKNLCICLLIEDILVLTMMEETSNKVVCGLIAGTLEYVLLAAFVWMLIEGIHLYRLMILVFETCPRTLRWYYLAGYGVPLFIVVISASIYPQGYGTSLYCWLDDKLIWGFAVPVAIIVLINFAMLILALRTASKVKVKRTQNKLAQFRQYVTGAISLTSILGLTWGFGFFYVNQSTVIFAYIFTVLNASQGIFIFIFHCIVNENVRKCILRRLARCKIRIPCKVPANYKPDETRQLKTPQDTNDGHEKADDGAAVWTLTNSTTLMTSLDSTNEQGKLVKSAITKSETSWNESTFH